MSSAPSFFSSQQFNAATVEPAQGFDPIPEGDYVVMVEKAEEVKVKNNGQQLSLQMRVMSGPYLKRTLFARITLWNQNTKATEIGRAQLSAFCRAVGVMTPKAAFEFCNRQLIVTVKVVTRQDNNQLSNEVKAYKPTSAPAVAGLVQNGTSAPSQPVQQQAPAPAPVSGPPPWNGPALADAQKAAVAQAPAQAPVQAPAPLPNKAPWAR